MFFRFLQGPETDPTTVKKIRAAIDNQTEVTVQLINYTKSGTQLFDILLIRRSMYRVFKLYIAFSVSGKKFWNIFHLQPMRDQKVQWFT